MKDYLCLVIEFDENYRSVAALSISNKAIHGWERSCSYVHIFASCAKTFENQNSEARELLLQKFLLHQDVSEKSSKFYKEFGRESVQKWFLEKFCTKCYSQSFGKKNLRETILNFLVKNLSRETLCKFNHIFPPKNLVYIRTNFVSHIYNNLIEILSTN